MAEYTFSCSLAGERRRAAGMSYTTNLDADDMLTIIDALKVALEPFRPQPDPEPQ